MPIQANMMLLRITKLPVRSVQATRNACSPLGCLFKSLSVLTYKQSNMLSLQALVDTLRDENRDGLTHNLTKAYFYKG